MKTERILIVIFLFNLFAVLVSSAFDYNNVWIVRTYITSQLLLLGYFIVTTEVFFYQLIFILFAIGLAGQIVRMAVELDIGSLIMLFSPLAKMIFGGSILIFAINESIKDKQPQVLELLAGVLLILIALIAFLPYFSSIFLQQESVIYQARIMDIPLLGVIATILSNSNIRENFKMGQIRIFIYILLITILPVAGTLFESFWK